MSSSENATGNFVSEYFSQSKRVVGRVKWFNSKTGFGFISYGKEAKDIFVHHSELQVKDEQYRYLTQGEYVEFLVSPTEDGSQYDAVAKSVTGLFLEPLLCETKRLARIAATSRGADEEGFEEVKSRKSSRGGGPRQLRAGGKRPSSPTKKSTKQSVSTSV